MAKPRSAWATSRKKTLLEAIFGARLHDCNQAPAKSPDVTSNVETSAFAFEALAMTVGKATSAKLGRSEPSIKWMPRPSQWRQTRCVSLSSVKYGHQSRMRAPVPPCEQFREILPQRLCEISSGLPLRLSESLLVRSRRSGESLPEMMSQCRSRQETRELRHFLN